MISVLLACVALGQQAQGQTQPSPNGATLISKMFKYYAGATSMTGNIHFIQKAASAAVTLDTALAFEAPSKLYIRQELNSRSLTRGPWLVTSDGNAFTYDYPNSVRDSSGKAEPGRLLEAVDPTGKSKQDFRQIFRAATYSLGDLSFPILVAIGGADELQAAKDQLITIQDMGTDNISGQAVHVLGGDWRYDKRSFVSGKYTIYITDEGQLKRYSQREIVQLDKSAPAQEVITTWDVALQVNAKPDEALFKVIK